MARFEDLGFQPHEREEMIVFGLDPDNLSGEDIIQWRDTTPPEGTPVVEDWARTAFEEGAPDAPPPMIIEGEDPKSY